MAGANVEPLSFTVAFDDVDGEGIIFFANYFRIANRALERYLPQVGIPWAAWFADPVVGAPLRHVEGEFSKPLRAGDPFTVKVDLVKLGSSSVQFRFDLFNAECENVAILRTTHVFVDRSQGKKAAIPQPILDVLSRLPQVGASN